MRQSFHSHPACRYQASVLAIPFLSVVPSTKPTSCRSRVGSHTQPGARNSAYFCRLNTPGLRVSQEVEYEGLDLGEHGERAYNY